MGCNCEGSCSHGHCAGGIGLGTIIAVLISWIKWHSIGWAIVHGFFGWFYVIYYFLTYGIDSI
jgi:hypothetical protein